MFVDPKLDSRQGGLTVGDERAMLMEFLSCQRTTLELKCHGVGALRL